MVTKSKNFFMCNAQQIGNIGYTSSSCILIGTPLDLRQFLAAESLLKMLENDFYFKLKAFFVLKTFKFWP